MGAQWLTAAYGLLACLGAGTLAMVGISEITGAAPKARRAASVAAALLCLAGLVAFACALGHPQSMMAVATNAAKGSPKSLEFVLCCLVLVVAVAYVVVDMRVESAAARRAVGVAGVACAVVACVAAGCSTAVGRPGLAVPLAVAWLGNAVAAGAALFGAVAALVDRMGKKAAEKGLGEVALPARVALLGLVVQTVGFVAVGVVVGFASVDPLLYWGGALAVGTLASAGCAAVSARVPEVLFAALACSAVGGACLRAVVLLAGTGSLNLIANAASRTAL